MDSLLSSIDASTKTAGLSGMLSSLGTMLNETSANPGVFAHFLQQNQTSQNTAPSTPSTADAAAPAAPTQNAAPQTDSAPAPAGGGGKALAAIKKIVSGLHDILEQLNRRDKAKSATNTAKTANTKTAGSAPTQNDPPPATASTVTPDDSSSGDGGDASGAATVTADSQTLAQLLSQLVTLMQMIEKKLELAQGATGASNAQATTATAAATDPAQTSQMQDATTAANATNPLLNALAQLDAALAGPTGSAGPSSTDDAGATQAAAAPPAGTQGAADPLTQLLALIKSIGQKLESAGADTAPAATTSADATNAADTTQQGPAPVATAFVLTPLQAPAASTPAPVTDEFSQLRKDLKTLLTALQTIAANNNSSGDAAAADASGKSKGGTGANNVLAASASTSKPVDATASDKTALPPVDDFFGLFASKTNNTFGGAPPVNPFLSPGGDGMTADAGDKDGGTFAGDGGDNTAFGNMNNAGAAANTTPAALPDGVAAAASPYSFASQLSNMRAVNGGMTGLPSVVDQVLLQLNRGVKDGNDQMTIQLQPADLGKINIRLDITSDNKVQGTVVADNQATLNLLLKDVRGLERALQEAGLRADPGSLQFSLGGQSGNSGNASGQTGGDFASGNSPDSGTPGGVPDTTLDITPDADETWYLTPGRVNFKV